MKAHSSQIDSARELAAQIKATATTDDPVETTLETSERVLARVTDGIYRQPGSAIRELISNAYDADATRVVIQTDRPRFETITVEDNGAGMTPATLAYLLKNIGGSSKRRPEGAMLGVAAESDPEFSPGGRRLIGRIGIGLFSVSQLTHAFQIITKVAGDDSRTVASVVLRQYGETDADRAADRYEAGKVLIWQEPASDLEAHGTKIVLDAIRPHTRRTLQSDAIWQAIEGAEADASAGMVADIPTAPLYHVGRFIGGPDNLLRDVGTGPSYASLPWEVGDRPDVAFNKLVRSVWNSVGRDVKNPRLADLFDHYLQMVWQLALAVPLPYVESHPFETPFESTALTYRVGEGPKPSAVPIELGPGETLAAKCGLTSQLEGSDRPFSVLFDDLQLARPLVFSRLPQTTNAVKKPLVLVGACRETFEEAPEALRGGPLSFEAYLLWNPKIAPTEHQGSLIRIHGASGTLFDSSFLRYQTSEQTRLRQTSCEIFVSEGLEAALNIDRESFNYAHPHVVFLTRWLHSALRQLATTQKNIGKKLLAESRWQLAEARTTDLERLVSRAWERATGDQDTMPPKVRVFGPSTPPTPVDSNTEIALHVSHETESKLTSSKPTQAHAQFSAVASVLVAHGVPDLMPSDRFQQLLDALYDILAFGD